ncbi:MAG: chromate transporter [Lachnospiraceae bacterium]|nr:chromate transporter [Lachnospiraceae bacterium]
MMLLELFFGFLKVGFFSFGGAYAAIPVIRDTVLSYGWLDDEMLSYIIAVSESTPGPIMINMATYVGSTQAGLLGSFLATLAVTLPAFIIILLIMVALKHLLKNPVFRSALNAMKPCIAGIILATGIYMIIENCFALSALSGPDPVSLRAVLLTAALAILYFGSRKVLKKGISPIALIAVSAVAGIVVYGV